MMICMFFLIFIVSITYVSAYFYYIDYKCEQKICHEGEEVTWFVTIENEGLHKMEFTKIEIFDMKNNDLVAEFNSGFNPLSSQRGNSIVVWQNKNVTVNITGVIPRQNYYRKFLYYPCITNAVLDTYALSKYEEYETTHCYKENHSVDVVECLSDDHCKLDSVCNYQQCTKLRCGECQYIVDHQCVDYECCKSSDCNFDEECVNNSCYKLDCDYDEHIVNNSCVELNCSTQEIAIDHVCEKLVCAFDEERINNSCVRLDCADNQYINNHRCLELNCSPVETAFNHTCIKLECDYDEKPIDHKCVKLNCQFYESIENHRCVRNNSIILKFSLELFAIIMIIIFLILDMRRYKTLKR